MVVIIALALLLSLVSSQEFNNQLMSGQHFQQMVDQNQQIQQSQQMQAVQQIRSAEPAVVEKSNQGQSVQAFVLSGSHQQQHHPNNKVVVEVGSPQHQHLLIQAGQHHQQQQHHHNQQEVIKVVEVEDHKKPVVVSQVHHTGQCHLLGRKGECVSVPRYFGCIVNGGILFMSFTECGFQTGLGCCVKNVIPFLSGQTA